ncbi:MAG: Gfo/Idh/MocA family oxidoreductase [Alphaproteobacteria bacterium]|nr:Gfo/Idh/MocA family oxidoreductase [Alphaproteobacteria bacterium]
MSDRNPVRLAVVGAGPIGRRHLQAIAAEPSCQAVAVVDPASSGVEAANEWSLPHYADLETMLDEVAPEGVINATPNSAHVPLSLACVKRGIPVLVEKPIADRLDPALALADASEAARVPVLVGHHRRHNPIVRKAREIVRSGVLGRLTAVSATWMAHKPDDYFNVAWRREAGGGPILINLIHDIDNLRFIAGDIEAVQGMTSNARRGFAVEDTAALLLRFRDGALGTVMLSDTVTAPWSWELTSGEQTSYIYPKTGQDCYLFAGTEGALAVPSLRLWRYEGAANWQSPLPEVRLPVDEADPIRVQASHFADVIRGRAEPLITARDAARTLEATLAVTRAAAGGGEIVLSG